MWKAELRLIELSFRSSKRKRRVSHSDDADDDNPQYKAPRVNNRKYQAPTIPIVKPPSTEEERKEVDEEMESRRVTHFPPAPSQPTDILEIQSKITDGPFYRTLYIISGIDAGDHIEHFQKMPIAPEYIGDEISLETLENFGYFIVQLIDKKLQLHFVHKSFLEKEFKEIKNEREISNDTINILKKTNDNMFSIEILYKSDESSSRDKPKRWVVFRKKHADVEIPMHAHMIEYFEKRPHILIPGMDYSTAGAGPEKSIML